MSADETRDATIARVDTALEALEHQWLAARDGLPSLSMEREHLAAALRALKAAGFETATFVTGVDRMEEAPRFEVVHQLLSIQHNARLRLHTRVAEGESVPTCTDLWPGARFMERECYDMFGILFEGHEGLKRLLMPEGYDHHPLRKDFPHQGIEPDRLYREWDRERRKDWQAEALEVSQKTFEYVRGAALDGQAPDAQRDEDDPLSGEIMQLSMGPQHPATHGVLRLQLELDGETMRSVEPVVGYLHRGKEKTCESLGWAKFFPHTDRLDYVQPLMNNIGYALALERLAELEVPERGQVIRVLLMEVSRIAAHLIYLGTTAIDLGAVSIFFSTFKERENIYSILDAYTGHRMNNTYVRIGGVFADVDESLEGMLREFLERMPAAIDGWEELLTGNRIWYDRNRNVGTLTTEQALAWSLTGPNLRATGMAHDLRKSDPYSGYEQYDFEVPIGTIGDCYDRYLVRVEEMRQSVRIASQALERLGKTRGGEFLAEDRRYVLPPKDKVHSSMEELIFQFKLVTDLRLPAGNAYHAIESSKGELGFYVVSDGTRAPVRCHIRAPGLMNVQAIPVLSEGRLFSDMVALIGSLDFVMGEVDR